MTPATRTVSGTATEGCPLASLLQMSPKELPAPLAGRAHADEGMFLGVVMRAEDGLL